jgi:hypothetical protein
MRADMSKVIVERPRYGRSPVGSDYPRGRLKNRWVQDLEGAPRIESMGGGYRDKMLSENLQPLVRYLRSNVGRPWSKVRSEISARISCNSAVQKHVLDHLSDYVSEDVVLDGRSVLVRRWGRLQPLVSRGWRVYFYVCPRTKLLRLAPVARRKRRGAEESPDRRPLDATHELRRIEGVWYELSFARIDGAVDAYDLLHGTHLDASALARGRATNALWRSGWYVAAKRQLSSREVARLPPAR